MRFALAFVVGIGLSGAALPLRAHHSFAAEFDAAKPFNLTGKITKVVWSNPHAWVYFDVVAPGATAPTNWAVELNSPNALLRAGWKRDTLTALCRSLAAAMTTAGLGRRMASRYTPHMTLLYGDGELAEQAVETIAWTVREFVLVHSVDSKSPYVPLGRWPLRIELPGAAVTKR